MKKSSTLLLTLLVFCNVSFADGGKKIVKWVDSQGVTHYGDKIPTQDAGRKNTELNKSGVAIKQNDPMAPKTPVVDPAKVEQDRKDSVLLASYTKPEEIDLARDRSLELDASGLQALTSQRDAINAKQASNQKKADALRKSNKPIPADISNELKQAQAETAKFDKQIADRKAAMEEKRKRFDADKARFIELKQQSSNLAPK